MTIFNVTFIISLSLLLHTYFFYPLILFIISSFYKKKYFEKFEHNVSILISVFNEEKIIEQRILNLLDQKNKKLTFEVIIGSDNSNDRTNELLSNYNYDWLKVVKFNLRRGKSAVLNDLVSLAQNQILIFTDANTIFEKNAITELLKPFSDPSVGGVCGRLILKEHKDKKSASINEKKYWQIESLLKKWEGDCGMVIGANGGIFAIRKELYINLPTDKPVTDDFLTTMNVLKAGYKFVYSPTAIAYEEVAPEIKDEFKRKVRFSSTNFQTLKYIKTMFFKNGLVSFGLWSHKIFRWIMPMVLVVLLLTNIFIFADNSFYRLFLELQFVFYLTVLVGFMLIKINIFIKSLTVPYYFFITNVALFIGLYKYLSNKHSSTWESTPR